MILGMVEKRLFSFLPVRHGASEDGPKFRAVMALAQMNGLVRDDIVRQPDGQLEQLPIEIDHPVPTA